MSIIRDCVLNIRRPLKIAQQKPTKDGKFERCIFDHVWTGRLLCNVVVVATGSMSAQSAPTNSHGLARRG